MRLTPATVEIPGGEMGDFMAEHLEEKREGCDRQFRGHAHHATIEVDASERPAKPSAPLNSHALFKAWESPAVLAVEQQTLDIHLKSSASRRGHAQEASTIRISESRAGFGDGSTGAVSPFRGSVLEVGMRGPAA